MRGNRLVFSPQCFVRVLVASTFDISQNHMSYVPASSFAGVSAFGTMNLSRNQLADLGPLAFYLLRATTLDLSYNNITRIEGGDLGAFQQAALTNLVLSFNGLTTIYADSFAGLNINQGITLGNNNISILADGWSEAFPLEASLDMPANPSQCTIEPVSGSRLGFVCRCANIPGILGNGAFCSTASCERTQLPAIAYGQFVNCPSTQASGQSCAVQCNSGYELLNASVGSATCLGGLWGQRPNVAGVFPSCIPKQGFALTTVVGASLGSAASALLVAFVVWVLVRQSRRIAAQDYDLELKERLLDQQHDELEAMRLAFTISEAEIQLERRVDGGSEGSFGEVWRAQWNDLTVAVKRLRPVMLELASEDSLREFEAETDLMRRLRHPNVVTFFGAGADRGGVPFLVCELMERSLQVVLWMPPTPISADQQLRWAHDAAKGMAFLHSRGLIHRDLKSANLLGWFAGVGGRG